MRILKQNIAKTKVMDLNAAFYGVSIYEWMDKAGRGIARLLNTKFKVQDAKLRIAFFCGLGNNGGDGFAAAKYLHPEHEVMVYLFGSEKDIKTEEARRMWKELKQEKVPYRIQNQELRIQNDYDIAVDCLLGTGVKGKLREPIATAIKQLNNLAIKHKAKLVVVDVPTPSVEKIDLAISMQFPKMEGAEVVDLQSDTEFLNKIGIGEFKALEFPGPDSHKGDSGKLLVIAGNENYHGAFLYSIKTASKIVDLVYFLSSKMNEELARKLRPETAEYIPVKEIEEDIDCIMIGPGTGKKKWTMDLAVEALKTQKKIVLDADVLEPEILNYLHDKAILTPHKAEFERTFQVKPTDQNVLKMAEKYNCTIVLKGQVDIVANPDWGLKYNYTGNVGMTKGGTGDVLAALIASFYCLTDDPYVASASGVFVNGLAGDELYQRVNRFYNSEDLIEQLPETMSKLIQRQ